MFLSIVSVVFLLTALIFVHELGHFLVAKWAGVKVEVFSIGFGKKIFRKKHGETEYVISIFPLGGYVKMFGDDPSADIPAEERRRAYNTQPLIKRFAIVLAGPAFNLFFALLLYFLIPLWGEETIVPRVAVVTPGSQAEQVGLRPGDEILSIEGKPIDRLSEFLHELKGLVGKPVRLNVSRIEEGQTKNIFVEVRPSSIVAQDIFGDPRDAAEIPGLAFVAPGTFIGVNSPKSWAASVGLKTNDHIHKINGKEVRLWPHLFAELNALRGKPVVIEVFRGTGESSREVKGVVPENGDYGIQRLELFVDELVAGSPAEKAGIKAGDYIAEVNATPISSFLEFKDAVAKAGEQGTRLSIAVIRSGERHMLDVVPEKREIENPVTHKLTRQWIIGLVASPNYSQAAEVRIVRITSPLRLIHESVTRTSEKIQMMVKGFWKLFSGQSSMKALGGPIRIADLASSTAKQGWVRYLELMAIISINLFLINLFPVPVLDGGHIFIFFLYEAIARRPMSRRLMERANQFGFAVILMLLVVTLTNDVAQIKPGLFSFPK